MRKYPHIETRWGGIPGTKKARRARGRQTSLGEIVTRGGRREGAGRKEGPRPNVRHRTRALHRHWQPVHVTMRRARGLPSFRCQLLENIIRTEIQKTGRGKRRVKDEGFRVIHYSIQHDHLHVILEADEHAELTKGMRSFVIRLALRVNKELGRRRGHVWGDRYHRQDIASPNHARNILVYVLDNHLKHGIEDAGLVDPFSSGRWFDGWMHGPERPPEPTPTQRPTTWLLREGWVPLGFINRGEISKSAWLARGRAVR
jgi:putative transposase